jgi:hypothetical protein
MPETGRLPLIGPLLAVVGFAIWTLFSAVPFITGRSGIREAWDADAYWWVGLPSRKSARRAHPTTGKLARKFARQEAHFVQRRCVSELEGERTRTLVSIGITNGSHNKERPPCLWAQWRPFNLDKGRGWGA